MAAATSVLLALFLTAVMAPVPVAGTDYTVGDAQGWTTGVDYSSWASGKNFQVGDTLLFQYGGLHSVDEVAKSGYDSCSTSNAKTSTDGNTKVSLTAAGTRYFICGTPGHCSGGMKLAVTIAAAGSGSGSGSGTPPSATSPPSGGSSDTPPTQGSPPPPAPAGNNAAVGLAFPGDGAMVLGGLIGLGIALVG